MLNFHQFDVDCVIYRRCSREMCGMHFNSIGFKVHIPYRHGVRGPFCAMARRPRTHFLEIPAVVKGPRFLPPTQVNGGKLWLTSREIRFYKALKKEYSLDNCLQIQSNDIGSKPKCRKKMLISKSWMCVREEESASVCVCYLEFETSWHNHSKFDYFSYYSPFYCIVYVYYKSINHG